MNIVKWCVAMAILIGGVVANLHYSQLDVAYRIAAGILVLAAVFGVLFTTTQGQLTWAFVKTSRAEMRKVVWPTRQETMQTLMVVVAMVAITAVILWGIDAFYMWLVGMITGQRG